MTPLHPGEIGFFVVALGLVYYVVGPMVVAVMVATVTAIMVLFGRRRPVGKEIASILPFAWRFGSALLAAKHAFLGAPAELDAAALQAMAEKQVGAKALWESPAHERAAIEATNLALSYVNQGTHLSSIGRLLAIRELFGEGWLARIRLQHYLAAHPEVKDVKVPTPVFIIGQFRTGTTFLQHLLSSDPAAASLKWWAIALARNLPIDPNAGPPTRSDGESHLNRMLAASKYTMPETWRRINQLHHLSAQNEEECIFFLQASLTVYSRCLYGPGWADHFLDTDQTLAYQTHKRFLQVLLSLGAGGSGDPSHFVLKCPAHTSMIDAIVKTYPDARFVWCHRDPCDVAKSHLALFSAVASIYQDPIDVPGMADRFLHFEADRVHKAIDLRAQIEAADQANSPGAPSRFFDCDFSEFVADPIDMIQRIHTRFGIDNNEAFTAGAQNYIDTHQRYAGGKYVYTLEQFGLSRDEIRTAFDRYCQTHGV